MSLNTDSQSLAKATENSINIPAAQTSSNSEVEIEKKTPVGKCPFGHGWNFFKISNWYKLKSQSYLLKPFKIIL